MKLFIAGILLGCFVVSKASSWTQFRVPLAEYNSTREDFPTINTEVYGTTFNFVVNSSRLAEVDQCVDTPAVTLSGYVWRVKICKTKPAGKAENFNIWLISDISEPGWSVDAKIEMYIKRATGGNYFQNNLDWKTFTAAIPHHANVDFLMQTTAQSYHNNGNYYFLFDILTAPAKMIEVEELVETTGSKIRLIVENVHLLTNETTVSSNELNIKGIRWHVVAKQHEGGLKLLVHANREDLSREWTIKANMNVQMLPGKGRNVQPVKLNHEYEFSKDKSTVHFLMLRWDQVVKENCDYVMKNTSAFLVEIKVQRKERIVLFQF